MNKQVSQNMYFLDNLMIMSPDVTHDKNNELLINIR